MDNKEKKNLFEGRRTLKCIKTWGNKIPETKKAQKVESYTFAL